MNQFLRVYEENKILDEIFHNLYDNFSKDTIEKNILELLVEIGELANETRCFKYWSKKGPSAKKIILDEYADCFLMALYFCNMKNITLDEKYENVNINDAVIQFKELYRIVSKLDYKLNRVTIKSVFSNLVNLGRLLYLSDDDIVDGCLKKIERNKVRFENGF